MSRSDTARRRVSRRSGAPLAMAAALLAAAPAGHQAGAQDPALNDYPTVARADYVFACMATNGRTRQALEQCACSIDHIATVLPWEQYVRAETVLRTLQRGGESVGAIRNSEQLTAAVDALRRAQAEADMLCF